MKPVLTREQFQYVAQCFTKWLQIRAKYEPRFVQVLKMVNQEPPYQNGPEAVAGQLGADIWHSALLERMLIEGKDPLPEPPPLVNSYPAYRLVEENNDSP